MKGSNFKSSSTFRQTSVQGNLFSGRPSCFNVFQSFLGFAVFSFSFSSKYAFFFFLIYILNCVLCSLSLVYIFCAIYVFDSDCLTGSYGVYYTVKPGNKIIISIVRIIKIFIIRKWNSLQGPFIHIKQVTFQRAKSYFLVSVVFCFQDFSSTIYQRVIWYRSINYACWEIFSWVFVKMWSIKVEVLLVILVGESINWLRPYIKQNSFYLFIQATNFYWVF